MDIENNQNYNNEVSSDLSFNDIFLALTRRKYVILGTIMLFLLLSGIFIITQQPKYTATTTIQFHVKNENVTGIDTVLSSLGKDESALAAEVDILKSRKLLEAVYKRLELNKNREFYDTEDISSKSKDDSGSMFGSGIVTKKKALDDRLNKSDPERKERIYIVDKLLDNLSISRGKNLYTTSISYSSESPELAAIIVNTIVDEYIVSQIKNRFEMTNKANSWLYKKVGELREKLKVTEEQIQKFREKNDLVDVSGETNNNIELQELSRQLVLAQSSLAEAESRLNHFLKLVENNDTPETLGEVLKSDLVRKLKFKEADALSRRSELEKRYGHKHPKMIQVNAELEEISSSISGAIEKIIAGIGNDVVAAESKVDTIELSLKKLRERLNKVNRLEMKMEDLIRVRDADKELYQSYLARFKETAEEKDLQRSEAKVLSKAEIPIIPSWPKNKLIVAVFLLLGVMFGTILALILEYLDNVVRTAEEVEKITGYSVIGMIPEMSKKFNIYEYVLDKLTSVYAESLRSVNTAVNFSNPDNPPKSILITSSTPQEGKSVFSISYAKLLANSGKKVLLIDCDLRKPTVHTAFETSKTLGLGDLIIGDASFEDVVSIDERSSVHYIRSFENTPNSQEILASDKMKEFIESAKKIYDVIVMDSPPVMAITDSIILSKIADSTIFIIRWEKTPKNIVKNSIKLLNNSKVKLSGTVLSRVNINKHKKYKNGDIAYCYGNYKGYYTD